jgi:hypothetical protein
VYFCDPYSDSRIEEEDDPARGGYYVGERKRDLAELDETNRMHYEAHRFNLDFGETYKNFTGGSEWLAMYPPEPPNHKMWRADYFGQTHTVVSNETHFQRIPPSLTPTAGEHHHRLLSIDEMRQTGSTRPFAEYRDPGTLKLTIKALSCAPRAFEIRHFLSDAEVDHVLELIRQKDLVRSTTGEGSDGSVSETRTSSTTWLSRESDPVLNVIYRRAADAHG